MNENTFYCIWKSPCAHTHGFTMRLCASLAICAAALCLLCCCGDSAGADKSETKSSPTTVDYGWLVPAMRLQLSQSLQNCQYKPLEDRLNAAILARLCCTDAKNMDGLDEMLYTIRACRYLPEAEKLENGKKLSEWLVLHREVSRLLFRAIAEGFPPPEAMKNFKQLVDADEKNVLAYSNLAVAFATSYPLAHYVPQPSPCTMVEAFAWYTKSGVKFKYDVKSMPYEVSRYLADTRLSLSERRWAVNNYRKSAKPAASYFDLVYDWDHFNKGEPKKISRLEYTLPNMKKVGGVCIEQAYYATEICKTLGQPACITTGAGDSGIGHAWVCALEIKSGGKGAYWDSTTGRYKEHRYFKGNVRNPVTGAGMLDCELMLLGEAAQLPLQRREGADLACTLAQIASDAWINGVRPDIESLRSLAVEYNASLAAGSKDKPVQVENMEFSGELSLDTVESLINKAIENNLVHRPVWELIIKLRETDRIPVGHLNPFFDTLVKSTAKQYPDYSAALIMRIAPTIKDDSMRIKVYARVMGAYGRRPDLQGEILITVGDDYRDRKKNEQAVKYYLQAAEKCLKITELVVNAALRAEDVLVKAGKLDQAIRIYEKLFAETRLDREEGAFGGASAYFRLGGRLVELLQKAGREDAAKKVVEQMRSDKN